ncbi:MAG TPA: MFS transporter [Candidatus Bathyarchaeia archaeon]|nr:MFS transporter [Candidatus Bathyarchaeia archaeon]
MRLVERLKTEFSFFRGNYLILVMSWILMDFGNELPGTYYPDYVTGQLGGSATILGMIMFVSMISLASVQFLGGYLADKYGRRVLVSTLTFGVAFSYIFFAAAPSWHYIMLGAAVQNICLLYQPALFALMSDSVPPEKRGMGFSILNLIMSVSTTPGPLVALMLVATYGPNWGMRIAYMIVMILYVSAAIVRLKLKESIKNPEKISIRAALRAYPQAFKEGLRVWKVVPASTRFLFFSELIMRFALALTQVLFLVYAFNVLQIGGGPVLDPDFQTARIRWGYIMTALFMCMIFASFPVGKLLDKIGRKIPLILSGVLTIPATLLFVYGNYVTVFVAMPLVGFAMLLGFSSYLTLFADLIPQEQRGKATGSLNFFANIFMAIGGATGGFLYDATTPQFPFLLSIVLVIPSTALLYFVREPKPEERQV